MNEKGEYIFQVWQPDCTEDKWKIIQGALDYIRKLEEIVNEGGVYEVAIDTYYNYLGITRHVLRKKTGGQ